MQALELPGRLISIGNMNLEDLKALPYEAPRALLEQRDGRVLLIAGLTREECRGLAPALGELVSVTLQQSEATS